MPARCTLLLACIFGLAIPASSSAQTDIAWATNARQFRGAAGPVTLRCPPRGRAGTVWGSDTYTDDSSVCTAAVHAGLITLAEGGTFLLDMRPGRSSYAATRRNGVASQPWDAWEASFSLRAFVEPEPEPPAPPPSPKVISWDVTAEGLVPNGRRFTFVCRPSNGVALVRGVDLYSWESSICGAAAHAGAITAARGGTVTIEMRPGRTAYAGSAQNGVTSVAGERTLLGFVLIRNGAGG